jgi:hypothetical protein
MMTTNVDPKLGAAKGKNAQPLPLSSVLRDLAVLRASDIDLSVLLSSDGTGHTAPAEPSYSKLDEGVVKSQTFMEEARKALKILDRDDVTKQGEKVENIRQELEEVDNGLESSVCLRFLISISTRVLNFI